MAEVPENRERQGSPKPAVKSGGRRVRKILLILVGVIVSLVILVAGVIGYDEWRFEHAASPDRDTAFSTGSSTGGAVSANTTERGDLSRR